MDKYDIRKRIAKRALNFVRECDSEGIVQNLVIKTFPGSGKTTTVMKTIDEEYYNWIYLAPFHDIIVDNLKWSKLREYSFVHLKGKGQEGSCLVPEYQKYAQKGLSIDSFCDSRCPYKTTDCPYYSTRRKIETLPQSWAGVHQHITSYLQTYLFNTFYRKIMMFNHYDVLIIDEFPFQVLYDQININRKHIDEVRDVLSFMDDTDEKEFMMDFLNYLTLATGNIPIDYKSLDKLFTRYTGIDMDEFLKKYDEKLLFLVSREMVKKPPEKIVYFLREIFNKKPKLQKLKWMIKKHKKTNYTNEGIYLSKSNTEYFKTLGLPVIALDATANINAWNSLLGDQCYKEEIDIKYKDLYQMKTTAKYPVSSWVETHYQKSFLRESAYRLADLIRRICSNKRRSVLICCVKRLRNVLKKYLERTYDRNNYQFAIYYNLRSRNEFYKECDTCIIPHEPNPPPIKMRILEKIINWNRELLKDLTTRCEMLQGIGRVRQNLKEALGEKRENVEIFVFPGAIYQKDKILPEATLIPYQIMGRKKEERIDTTSYLAMVIRFLEKTTFRELYEYIAESGYNISKRILKSELKILFKKGFITNYKNKIEWVVENEKKRKKTEYKVS